MNQVPSISDAQLQYLPQAVVPLQAITDEASNLQIAISNREYPVTPGDVYTLTFLLAGEAVSNTLLVESDYTINMTIFGKLNAEGMTFAALKPLVEQKIDKAYPRSLPSLTISSVGVFQVPLLGEVPESRFVTAWGLSRVSEIVEDNLGDYSSIRDVQIISADGLVKRCDLLMAVNYGVLSENPFVRPNDRVIVSRVKREVAVSGEVYRPGSYQLKISEGIDDLAYFTGGFTPTANINRVKVDRYSSGRVESFTMDYNNIPSDFELKHGDVITVPTIVQSQPVVYIEGSVEARLTPTEQAAAAAGAAADVLGGYNRLVVPVKSGETLYDIVNALRDRFLPFADLKHGYVFRGDDTFEVDIERLLYEFDKSEDMPVLPFDRIIIPVKRPEVYVTGAAAAPGVYTYNPGEDYLYYVNMAGGFDALRNRNRAAVITSKDGIRRDPGHPVQPGDTINVITNDFLFNFNQYFPAITTGLGLIVTIVTLTNLLNQTAAAED